MVKRRLLSKPSDFDEWLFQLNTLTSGPRGLALDTFTTGARYAELGCSFAS